MQCAVNVTATTREDFAKAALIVEQLDGSIATPKTIIASAVRFFFLLPVRP